MRRTLSLATLAFLAAAALAQDRAAETARSVNGEEVLPLRGVYKKIHIRDVILEPDESGPIVNRSCGS